MSVHPFHLLDKAAREELYIFTARAFELLHPGELFVFNWHIDAMCHQMMAVADGRQSRLLITVPPRHLKSITVSVSFTAWLLGRDPSLRIMVASYGDDLASKHGQDCRTVLESEWYKHLYPGTQLTKRVATDLQTSKNGGRNAVSTGGAVTGFGADILIIDDMMKAGDASSAPERQRVKDYYDQTLVSRLNDKQHAPIVAIQQRLHEDDLAAYLIDKGYKHLNLPAIAEEDEAVDLRGGRTHKRSKNDALFPQREPADTLEKIRRDMGQAAFSAQYQQNPVAPGGNRFRWEWVQTYDADQRYERSDFVFLAQSWDTACGTEPSSDYSACTTWGLRKDGKWLLLEVERSRLDFPSLKGRVIAQQRRWDADKVLIEEASSGMSLLQEIAHDERNKRVAIRSRVFLPIKSVGNKEDRLDAQTGKVEAGEVLFPSHAPWMDAFKKELLAFPLGTHDDQVDSMAQFLAWMGTAWTDKIAARRLRGDMSTRPRSRMGVRFAGRR